MGLMEALLLEPYPFECWIAYRTDGLSGDGTISSPWDGSTAEKLDARLNALPVNSRVHLGPSPLDGNTPIPFQTCGYAEGINAGWQPKRGMK